MQFSFGPRNPWLYGTPPPPYYARAPMTTYDKIMAFGLLALMIVIIIIIIVTRKKENMCPYVAREVQRNRAKMRY